MPAPMIAVCPSCSAKLKLKAAPAAGKKLKCPKCEKVFVPAIPKAEEDDPWDLPDESSQGASDDDWGGDEEEPSYTPSRSRRTPVVSRSSSGSGAFPTAIVAAVVGIFALIFLGLIAGPPLVRAISDAMKPKVDPAYFIAGDLGLAIQLEPPRLLAMPDLPPAWRQGADFDKTNADLKAQLGVEISDIQVVRLAMPIPAGPPQPGTSPTQQMRGQLILSKPPVFPAAQTTVSIEGIPCYSDTSGKSKVLYCAGKNNTVLFAEEQTMRACLGAWKRGDAKPPEPVLQSTLVSMSMATAPIAGSISQMQQSPFAAANPMMPVLQSFQANVKSITVGIGPMAASSGQPEEPRISIQFFSEDDAKASSFGKSLEEALNTASTQLGNPIVGAMLGDKAGFAKTVASTKPVTSGRSVTLSVSLPQDFMKQVVQSMPAPPGRAGGGLPTFPGPTLPMSPPGGFGPPGGATSPGLPGAIPGGAIPGASAPGIHGAGAPGVPGATAPGIPAAGAPGIHGAGAPGVAPPGHSGPAAGAPVIPVAGAGLPANPAAGAHSAPTAPSGPAVPAVNPSGAPKR